VRENFPRKFDSGFLHSETERRFMRWSVALTCVRLVMVPDRPWARHCQAPYRPTGPAPNRGGEVKT